LPAAAVVVGQVARAQEIKVAEVAAPMEKMVIAHMTEKQHLAEAAEHSLQGVLQPGEILGQHYKVVPLVQTAMAVVEVVVILVVPAADIQNLTQWVAVAADPDLVELHHF
jgi:hypothetical protein